MSRVSLASRPVRSVPAPDGRAASLCLIPLVALVVSALAIVGDSPWVADQELGAAVSSLSPDARVSDAQAVLLRGQYRHYLRSQALGIAPEKAREAARKYNAFAAQCCIEVFGKTSLPRSVP